jgi:hypothetical protein
MCPSVRRAARCQAKKPWARRRIELLPHIAIMSLSSSKHNKAL